GHFGHLTIGRAVRALVAFVMVLSFSRRLFLRFYVGQQTENFLRGHEAAFAKWGGVPRVILYDNLKSAVLERVGEAVRFNPLLLAFAMHYRYEPRPVAVARGTLGAPRARCLPRASSRPGAARDQRGCAASPTPRWRGTSRGSRVSSPPGRAERMRRA